MPAPTCVQCERGYKIEKTGVYLVEMFNRPPRPYKVWHADLWECPQCGDQITHGYGENQLMEHFEEGFDEWLGLLKDSGAMIINQYEE